MNEEDIKTILEEPIPSQKTNKKKSGRKKKQSSPKKEEESIQPQQQPQQQQQQQPQQESVNIDEISVPINLSFLVFMRNLLTDIVPRTKWRADEMGPVGMALSEMNNLIRATTEAYGQNEASEETSEENADNVD
jgi:hypothetical protein